MTSTDTTRAAYLMTFTAAGKFGGQFTAYNRRDWKRMFREARERAGADGSVLLYSATVAAFTGKVLSVSATPKLLRAAA